MLRQFRTKEIGSLLAQFAHHHPATESAMAGYGTTVTDLRQFIASRGFPDCTDKEIAVVLTQLHQAGVIWLEYWSKYSKNFEPWEEAQASLIATDLRLLSGRSRLYP